MHNYSSTHRTYSTSALLSKKNCLLKIVNDVLLYKLSEDKVKAASQKNWEIPADDLLWAQRKTKLANFRVKWSLLKKYCFCSTLLVCLMTKQVLISVHNWNLQLQLPLYIVAVYSFRGNYSFLDLEIVKNSNSCRKFQFFFT